MWSARFTQAQEADWDSMVASSREKLPTDFFSHVENLIRASYEDIPKRDGALLQIIPHLKYNLH